MHTSIKKGLLVGLLIIIVLSNLAPIAQAASYGDLPEIQCAPIVLFGDTDLVPDIEFPDFLCVLQAAVQMGVLAILFAINWLFANLLEAFASALLWMIKLGVAILQNPAVEIGMGYTLQIANVLFVVAIIAIAFATILRWHEYEAKKMLPKLIIAALLVNFSLLIAGLFVDIGNVFTNTFVEKITHQDLGKAISPNTFDSSFRKQITYKLDAGGNPVLGQDGKRIIEKETQLVLGDGKDGTGGYWTGFLILFPRALLGILMTFFGLMAMIAATIMALVRNLWVVLLIITMPLVWALWVLPRYEEYWKSWWRNFLNWGVIYLPVVTFFLFVAVQAGIIMQKDKTFGADLTTTSGIDLIGESFFQAAIRSLIIIGLMIGGLKIAQAMGSTIAGAFASMAGTGGRKLAGGLLRGGLKAAVLPYTALGGAALGALKGATYSKGKYNTDIKERLAKGEEILTGRLNPPSRWKTGFKGIFSGAKSGVTGDFIPTNLYGRATSGLSTWAAGLSFLPGFGAAAEFFGKTSAAQREAINRAAAGYDNLSEAGRNAKYKAMEFGSATDQAGAMLAAEKHHDHLPGELAGKFADVVTAFYPGVARKEISLLKEMAGHDPFNAKAISGESAEDVFKRADGEMARKWDMSHWNSSNITMALKSMNDSIKRAAASKNDFNRNLMLTHAINRLGDISVHMNDEQKKSMSGMLSDFAAVRSGTANADIMNRLEGHLEKLSDTDNKDIRGKFAAEQRTALNFGKDIARVITGVKSKSEHGSHGNLRDFEIKNMIGKVVGGAFSGLLGNVKAAVSSTSKGHGGEDTHSNGGH